MRTIWHSDSWLGRLVRLSFVIASFVASFVVVASGLSFVGASAIDAHGGGAIVALVSAAFAMYG